MKTYGVKRKDRGCCPGHDKYPKESYNSRRSKKAHRIATKQAHRRGRALERAELHVLREEYESDKIYHN